MPSIGMNRETGKLITDWDQVAQSIGVLFTTRIGDRVLRRTFGSQVPRLLGENMVPATFVRWVQAVGMALDLWEPRVRLRRVVPQAVDRSGAARLRLEFLYRPRALQGDFTVEGARTVDVVNKGSIFTVTNGG